MEGGNERIIDALNERLEEHDNSRKKVQEMLHGICDKMRKEIDEMEEKVLEELEVKFTDEDTSLQSTLNELRTLMGTEGAEKMNLSEMAMKAKAKLLTSQSYDLERRPAGEGELSVIYGLRTERRLCLEYAEMAKPWDIRVTNITEEKIFIQFGRNIYEEDAIIRNAWETGTESPLSYKALLYKKGENFPEEYIVIKEDYDTVTFSVLPKNLEEETEYAIRVKGVCNNHKESEWSDPVEFRTPRFSGAGTLKKCPIKGYGDVNYSVYKYNGKTMELFGVTQLAITGDTAIPTSEVFSWNVKITNSENNNGKNIFIGVAPISIRDMHGQNNYTKNGWFFHCHNSTLHSGPPHNYKYPGKEYGPRMFSGEYVHTGDMVGVVMDTGRGDMSFVVNGINYGIAFEGIPLDKPLIPCTVLSTKGDSIEMETSVAREIMDAQIPAPSNLVSSSDSWDSITFSWDPVPGALFYQIEVDRDSQWMATGDNSIRKQGLKRGSEHFFKVRAVRGNAVGEWSYTMNGRTQEATAESWEWKKCPEEVCSGRKYALNENNHRIATKIGDYELSTIIGNMPLLPNKVASWNIKIVKSKYNILEQAYIGVAPTIIDQNEKENNVKCGWYFDCQYSKLVSWNHQTERVYRPTKRKEEGVQVGDSIGVVMDMRRGDLSFFKKGKYLGLSFKGIPLDKPLVPCVLLRHEGDTIELESFREDIDLGNPGKKEDMDPDKKDCIIS